MPQKKIKNNMSSSGLTRGSTPHLSSSGLTQGSIPHLSSSGLTRGSRNGVESGRSMVEMLGVLAVVGVLSVGGIAGYTYAMNKHYANELLAGASERAVLLTAQIASGRKPSLKEFANHTTAGGTFATEDESVRVYTDGVGIPVSGVKEAVCENLIKATDGTDILITDSEENEMSADNCAEESNDLLFVFETGIGGVETSGGNRDVGVCDNGNVYLSNMDDPCETELSPTTCSGDENCEEGCCHPEWKICIEPYCEWDEETEEDICQCETGNKCVKNSDCADGEFCNIKATDSQDLSPSYGSCEEIGKSSIMTYIPTKEEFLRSDALLTWWGAENWCTAQGLQLISPSKIQAFTNEALRCSAQSKCDGTPELIISYFENAFDFWTNDNEDQERAFRVAGISHRIFWIYPHSERWPALCSGLSE